MRNHPDKFLEPKDKQKQDNLFKLVANCKDTIHIDTKDEVNPLQCGGGSKQPRKSKSRKSKSKKSKSRNSIGRTELMAAAEIGDTEKVEKLLQNKNIDVCARNKLGWTATMRAAMNGHGNIVNTLIHAGCPLTTSDMEMIVSMKSARERK